jgi:hypothetical protein
LDIDEIGKLIDQKKYRSMIRSLLCLTTSRPDIMFSACACARFKSNPKKVHLNIVKRIFRYLQRTQNFELVYYKQSSIELLWYSGANFASNKSERKSTSGTCQMLGNSLISWFSQKQNCVALSTTKAEYDISLSN